MSGGKSRRAGSGGCGGRGGFFFDRVGPDFVATAGGGAEGKDGHGGGEDRKSGASHGGKAGRSRPASSGEQPIPAAYQDERAGQ